MPVTTINEARLHYEVRGNGPPILFIHGGFGGMSSTLFPNPQDWASALTDRYSFVCYDRRAAGRSEYPDTGFDLRTFANDARSLHALLDLPPAFVMGDSAGGPIAITLALAHPEIVRGLVLAETGARLLGGTFAKRVRERFELMRSTSPEVAYERRKAQGGVGLDERKEWFTLPSEHAERLAREGREAAERVRATTRADRVRWYAGELRNYSAYFDVDLHPELGRLRMPTLVLHGDRDGLVPFSFGERLAAEIPDAELATISGADHGLMYFPGAVEALSSWLDRQTSADEATSR